ncbi:Protein of unknown function DUF3039 [Pseudofrankia inefficax]|uniref:DUF3039 domain-containing protein n=1 Tax=Pseudofrankia inefficax (strain DSM 45817 / CECT 9037 / DDB 130130 / EuI1c) TaxID=298654 RepID=E3J5Y3_PSEI1|nr:Protein of unknown function DUF3039 [Pseudofrankia inefficax]
MGAKPTVHASMSTPGRGARRIPCRAVTTGENYTWPVSTTQIRPETSDTRTGEGDDYSHFARREDIVRASIEGGRVTALCGFKFEPVRDPSRFPVCPKCKELVEMAEQFG